VRANFADPFLDEAFRHDSLSRIDTLSSSWTRVLREEQVLLEQTKRFYTTNESERRLQNDSNEIKRAGEGKGEAGPISVILWE